MGLRHALVALALTAAAGCGTAAGGATTVASGEPARVLVTREFGARTLVDRPVAHGQSALAALHRVADVGTAYEGRFVAGIEGIRMQTSPGTDWFYFVNGFQVDMGAADYTLARGDVEWWDYRRWDRHILVPLAIGTWPEPFVHGFEGRRRDVQVTGPPCADELREALRAAGARVVDRRSRYSVEVATFAEAGDELDDPTLDGLTVYLDRGAVRVLGADGQVRDRPDARAVIAGLGRGGPVGTTARVVVAGADEAAACAAASTLAEDPVAVAGAYAVALDGEGRILASGGQP